KQSLTHDCQRQTHHLFGDVQRFPIPPTLSHAHRVRRHHFGIGGHSLAVEGGLSQTSLATMEIAFTRQQSFTQQAFGSLEHKPFGEALIVRDQNILDVVRMIEEKRLLRANLEVSNIAIALREVLKIRERTATVRKHTGKRKRPLRTGRKGTGKWLSLLVESHCVSDLKRNGGNRQTTL